MKALYAARVRDLGPGDLVKVMSTGCLHEGLLRRDQLRMRGEPLPELYPRPRPRVRRALLRVR
jgi:hypothetical protein